MTGLASTDEVLNSIDSRLKALIALTAFNLMKTTDLPDPSYPSLDLLLSESGMSSAEIAIALGKTPGAVRKQVERDRKKG